MRVAPLGHVDGGSKPCEHEAQQTSPQPVHSSRTSVKGDPYVLHMAMVTPMKVAVSEPQLRGPWHLCGTASTRSRPPDRCRVFAEEDHSQGSALAERGTRR